MKWMLWCFTAVVLMLVLSASEHPGKHHGRPTPTPTPVPPPPQVTLAWDASSGATGYHLWTGFASGQENQSTDVGNVTEWTLQLTAQTTYFFEVTAYDPAGESPFSNEIQYTTP